LHAKEIDIYVGWDICGERAVEKKGAQSSQQKEVANVDQRRRKWRRATGRKGYIATMTICKKGRQTE
jgi:hypothetical protein